MLGVLVGFTLGFSSKPHSYSDNTAASTPASTLASTTTNASELALYVESLTAHNQQQANALAIAEESMAQLAQQMDAQQRAHEFDVQELELYRRIESDGSQQGLKVESVELVLMNDWPALRVTLFQVGGRDRAKGTLGAALIGADLAGAEEGRLVVVDAESALATAFEFQFFTRLSIPLPSTVPAASDQNSFSKWLEGLDLVEIDLIPEGLGESLMRITVPANQITVGFLE